MGGTLTEPNQIKDVYTKLVFYDNGSFKIDDGSDDVIITTAANFSAFNAAGDSGTSQITNNETLTLTGGTGITTSVANDAVTFNVSSNVVLETETINGGDYQP